MILDHIHYFFSFTGKIPLFFSWIGRLAAPLFLFCIVEGFLHTHDRKNIFCAFTPSPFSWDWCSFPSIILHPASSGRTAFSRRIRCLHPFPSCSSFFGASTGVRKNSGSGDFLPS
ncbi:MAG: TraX family protein [Roseburia hominis]